MQSLGWAGDLEMEMATHSSILAWRIPMDRGAGQAIVHAVTKSQTRLSDTPSVKIAPEFFIAKFICLLKVGFLYSNKSSGPIRV